MDLNIIPVVCSCDRQTVLVWQPGLLSEEGVLGAYLPQDLSFKYKENTGWYCGIEGHRMKKFGTMDQQDYKNALMDLSEQSQKYNDQ